MRNRLTPADRALARLDVVLAERLGEEVDPRVRALAEAEFSLRDDGSLELSYMPVPQRPGGARSAAPRGRDG